MFKLYSNNFARWTLHGYFLFMMGLQIYTSILLLTQDVVWELVVPSLLFFAIVVISIESLILIGQKRNTPLLVWGGIVGGLGFSIMDWLWFLGAYGDFGYLFQVWPVVVILFGVWAGLLLISIFFTLFQGMISIGKIFSKKIDFSLYIPNKKSGLLSANIFVGFLLLAVFALNLVNGFNDIDHITRYIELEDSNTSCTFAIWNRIEINPEEYQLGSTQELDLSGLSAENIRLLTALGRMNTTLHTKMALDPNRINTTVAYMKLLKIYNISVVQTINYDEEVLDDFPKPYYPENWIKNARFAMEQVIANNITNIIGICADSEGSAENLTAEEYFTNIATYETFLKEVQSNTSLHHPGPDQEAFRTYLVIEPRYLQDRLDGMEDTDIMTFRRMWGGMEWTDYHFMVYRTSKEASTSEMYNYLTHIKNLIGLEHGAPICGITGVRWFADGYFEGAAYDFGDGVPDYQFDGIDGWDAMKREILFSKAMGFSTVSLFKLNANDDPTKVEGYGLNDTYGIERIEELADEWNQPKTVRYPISFMNLEFGQRGFYPANHEVRYDLYFNPETTVFQIVILIGIIVITLKSSKNQETIV